MDLSGLPEVPLTAELTFEDKVDDRLSDCSADEVLSDEAEVLSSLDTPELVAADAFEETTCCAAEQEDKRVIAKTNANKFKNFVFITISPFLVVGLYH